MPKSWSFLLSMFAAIPLLAIEGFAQVPSDSLMEGTDQYGLAMTVRDFSKAHPDFDFGNLTGNHSVKGVVMPNIGPGPGRKPMLNPPVT
jgi:hypothetical protein